MSELTLEALARDVERGERDCLLTLREAARVTGETYAHIRYLVYTVKLLRTVPFGPTCRMGIPASVLVKTYCGRTPDGKFVVPARAVTAAPEARAV